MKIKQNLWALLLIAMSLTFVQCTTDSLDEIISAQERQAELTQTFDQKNDGDVKGDGDAQWWAYCDDNISGFEDEEGYHDKRFPINVACIPIGSTVTILYNSLDLPNRFTIQNVDGTPSPSETSGWIGEANYAGPWYLDFGDPCNNPGALDEDKEGSLSFVRLAGGSYSVQVESIITECSESDLNTWEFEVKCECISTPGPGPEPAKPQKD